MDNGKTKKKCAPFSKEEEIRLLEAIYSERHIIENKETNKLTSQEKEKAWSRVAVVYNAGSTERRNMGQLKTKFDNLKTKTRKTMAHERAHMRGTGGGAPMVPNQDPVLQLVLKIINEKTVVGLESPFDSDVIMDYVTSDREDLQELQALEYSVEESHGEMYHAAAKSSSVVVLATEKVKTPPPSTSKNIVVLPSEEMGTAQQIFWESVKTKHHLREDDAEMASCSTVSKKLKESVADEGQMLSKKGAPKSKWEHYTPRQLKEPVSRKLRPTAVSSLAIAKEDYYRKKAKLIEEEIQLKRNQNAREAEDHTLKQILLKLEIERKTEELKRLKTADSGENFIVMQ